MVLIGKPLEVNNMSLQRWMEVCVMITEFVSVCEDRVHAGVIGFESAFSEIEWLRCCGMHRDSVAKKVGKVVEWLCCVGRLEVVTWWWCVAGGIAGVTGNSPHYRKEQRTPLFVVSGPALFPENMDFLCVV
jgi:hypothetical protein